MRPQDRLQMLVRRNLGTEWKVDVRRMDSSPQRLMFVARATHEDGGRFEDCIDCHVEEFDKNDEWLASSICDAFEGTKEKRAGLVKTQPAPVDEPEAAAVGVLPGL